jgi:LPXTG-motif cell wall-anchored protein
MNAHRSSSFHPIRSALVAVCLGAAMVVPFAGQAFAHVAPATGSSQCEAGLATWQATVSILNDYTEAMTITAIASPSPVSGVAAGTVVPAGASAGGTLHGLSGASVTVTWTVTWPNGDTATNSATVARPAVACVETIVTTTTPAPTTTVPVTTTTVPGTTTTAAPAPTPAPEATPESPAPVATTIPESVLGEGPVVPSKAPTLPVLPVTGSTSGSLVVAALVFLLAGIALLVAASRRRLAASSAA